MKNVCVITGGGSGMGLAAARYMPKEVTEAVQMGKKNINGIWFNEKGGCRIWEKRFI